MKKMIAQRDMSYPIIGGASIKSGEEFDVQDQDVYALTLGNLAIEVQDNKREYERRDMVAKQPRTKKEKIVSPE